jgi:hypothetical protein
LEQIRIERSETARTQQIRQSALSAADIRYLYGLRCTKTEQP